MTKLTIKEKMAEIIRKRTAEFSNPFYSDDDLAQILANTQDAILKDFARLICEEMMEEGEVDAYNAKPGQCARCYEYDDCSCGGYYQRIEEEKLKAEEILKALE